MNINAMEDRLHTGIKSGESMLALCLGAGGTHYNFMDEGSEASMAIGFAPFSNIQKLTDRIWAVDYVVTILTLHGVVVNLDIEAEIRRAMELLATRPGCSFTDLAQLVQTREVRQVLGLYERDLAGGMLNAKEDTVSTSRFTVFKPEQEQLTMFRLEQFMERGDKHVVPVLLYLIRMIERALDGSPTVICLDEAWVMVQHPMFEEKLKVWFKVLGKANAKVVFV